MTTIVIFRWEPEGGVFALFPELPSDNYGVYCTGYQHIGQHCAADYFGCIARSRPATPTEYADLFEELERRGYHLDVHQRATPVMHENGGGFSPSIARHPVLTLEDERHAKTKSRSHVQAK